MIQVTALDHVVLRTTRLDAMLTFYSDLLGCHVERTLPPEYGLVQLRAGNALIDIVTVDSEMGRRGGKAPSQDGRNVDHFCLQIAAVDEDALLAYLDARNVPHSEFADRYGASGEGPSIYLEDPEGNVVELRPPRQE